MSHHLLRALRRAAAATMAAALAGAVLTAPAASAPPPPSLNSDFVTREGSELLLGGETFRASGANIYWLGLDENVGGVDFPTYFRIKDALDTADQLGVNVVRSHMATSTGQDNANALALMPELGVYNEEAFRTIDYAIAYAGSLGIRLILPLTDEWSYYHGGHRDFTAPLGLEPADFYTDRDAITAYQDYVEHVLQHVNPLTGLKLVDDPTILAWELGNELEGMTLPWIDEQVAFIRGQAPEQLVAAGRRFDIDPDTLQAADLDIVDVHYYPPTAEKIQADAAAVAAAGKVYIAGEYASTAATDAVLQPAAADSNVSGMFFWSLFGNNDRGGLVPHDDGFTLHYPGETDRMRASIAAVQGYSTALGLPVDQLPVAAPLVTAIDQSSAINRISWRGTAGATGYRVQRSTDGSVWTDVSDTVSASASPVTDLESPAGVSYRVLAITSSGTTVTSDPVAAAAGGNVLVDPLADWKLTSSHAAAQVVPPAGARALAGAQATWNVTGIDSGSFVVTGGDDVVVSASNDGQTWTELPVEVETSGEVTTLSVTGVQRDYLRVSWPTDSVLGRATISSAAPRVALFDPLDDFSRASAHAGSLSFDTSNPNLFDNDASRLKRDAADGNESITWTYDDISGADLVAYAWPDQPVEHLTFHGSLDGATWTPLEPEILGGTGSWTKYTYRVRDLSGVNFLRASWSTVGGEVWTPQISQLSLFSPNAPEIGVPSEVELVSPADGRSDVQSTPVFSWNPSQDAAYYRFVLATDPGLTERVRSDTGLSATSFQPPIDLEPGTTYYWQVEAVNGLGATASTVRTFATAPLPTESLVIDDFETYADDAALTATYPRNTGGGAVATSLTPNPITGTTAGRFSYDLGAPGYAGVTRQLTTPQSWWGYRGLGLTLEAPVGATVTVQFVAGGGYWEALVPITEAGPHPVEVAFDQFAPPSWAGESRMDLSSVTQYSLYIADSAVGDLVVDDIVALAPIVEPEPEPEPEPVPGGEPQPVPGQQPGPATVPGADGNSAPAAASDGAGSSLARTGADIARIGALALTLTMLGALAVWARRRQLS